MFPILRTSNYMRVSCIHIRTIFHKPYNAALLTKKCNFSFPQSRTFFWQIFRRPTARECQIRDKVSDGYSLIYRNKFDRYLLLVQLVSTTTTALIVLWFIFSKDSNTGYNNFTMSRNPYEKTVYVTSFVCLAVVLQAIIYKIPVRIYYSVYRKQYVMLFYGSLPGTRRRVICKVGEVQKEEKSTLWSDTQYMVKNQQSILLFEDYFKRPFDLHVMLGLQKDTSLDNASDEGENYKTRK